MEKYQPEGQYDPIKSDMQVLDVVTVIKVTPKTIRGKYKIGQNLQKQERIELANKILKRNTSSAKKTLEAMGFEITEDGLKMVDEPIW